MWKVLLVPIPQKNKWSGSAALPPPQAFLIFLVSRNSLFWFYRPPVLWFTFTALTRCSPTNRRHLFPNEKLWLFIAPTAYHLSQLQTNLQHLEQSGWAAKETDNRWSRGRSKHGQKESERCRICHFHLEIRLLMKANAALWLPETPTGGGEDVSVLFTA